MAPHSEIDLAVKPDPTATGGGQSAAFLDRPTRSVDLPGRRKDSVQSLHRSGSNHGYDLICVGFGPASLAIAVALHDALYSGEPLLPDQSMPKVLFLEKQSRFSWHAGMLLPGAKMQISFVKDLATLRDPRSRFTFLNYLHQQGRLVDFTNLGTFLPSRVEYEDYLRWCASHFQNVVEYGHEVVSISREAAEGPVREFQVASRGASGQCQTFSSRNVLVAMGGQPYLPEYLPPKHPRVIHSSQYAHLVPQVLSKSHAPYRVAVVGAGQSAAEIFNNIQALYPNSRTWLVMRQEFLRPSDDSPFVNSIFNPSYVDSLYSQDAQYRQQLLRDAKATNYGVVRLELIEQLYERMYDQRREHGEDEALWPHRILGGSEIQSAAPAQDGLALTVRSAKDARGDAEKSPRTEVFDVDLLICATGYQRNAHVDMMQNLWDILPPSADAGLGKQAADGWSVSAGGSQRKLEVGRDYKVRFSPGAVGDGSGVWLQGCCEETHGLSDTLLSILATRSGEMVQSIFGPKP